MINDFFNIFLPQGCLIIFILLQLILSMFISPRYSKYARFISCFGISCAIALLSTVQTEPQYFGFKNAIMSDSYTLLFHFIILLCGFFTVLLTKNLVSEMKQNAYTFHSIMLTGILGGMLVVSANDFLTLFISIELLSFATYFLIASKKGYFSKEASFKYLITNAVASGIFLFGVSYLYGMTSCINLSEIYEVIIDKEPSLLYALSGIMIVFGLISKLAIFPFANWIIDVYKGTETSILAFLSTIPKIALFGIVCRLLVFSLGSSFELTFVIAVISIVTALWANVYAIKEKNVKIILACSSAANASYVMIAACLVSVYNLSTVIFYLACYVLMNLAVFAYLNVTESNGFGFDINDFKGLFHKNNGLTIVYSIAIVALAGFPITSGFVAKIYLFSAIANSGMIFVPFLLVVLLLTVIALYYYLKIIVPLFIECDGNYRVKILKAFYSQKFVLVICVIVTVLIGIYPEKIMELCKFIAYNI